MKKIKIFGLVLLVLLGILMANSAFAAPVPAAIDFVKVNGDEVTTTDTNRLDLQRGEDITVKVKLTATSNDSNVEIEAFISGYEYAEIERIADSTPVFDIEQGASYIKTLKLKLPAKAEKDDYRLRILVSDRNSEPILQNYRIKIGVPRHALEIRDVIFNPEGRVQAGRALLTMVRVKNIGDKKEEGIRVRVSIPELGVSASDYIDEIKSQDATTSEELYMRLPVCAKPKVYDVNVVVEFNNGVDQVSRQSSIEVIADPACEAAAPEEKTIITLAMEAQDIKQGSSATYPITINNNAASSKSFSLSIAPLNWAATSISPSNIMVLNPNEAKTAYVLIAANENAPLGVQAITVSVKDASGATVKDLSLKANILESKRPISLLGLGSLRNILEIGLVVLLLVLIVIGFVMVFRRKKEEGKEYY